MLKSQPEHTINEQRIAILRALQLGDMMCAVPAFRAIRAGLPHAHITLIGLPWTEAFVRRFSAYLDRWIEFPGYPGLPEIPARINDIPDFIHRMQSDKFDWVIQMHGSGSIVNPLVGLMGGTRTAGYFLPNEYCPDPNTFIQYPRGEPEVLRHLRLTDHLGLPNLGKELEFPMGDADWQSAEQLLQQHNLHPGEYICIHPGSRSAARRWPLEYFAKAADLLADSGWRIVLTGSNEEVDLVSQATGLMRSPVINLAGKMELGCLAGVLASSRLLVCNDTGVSHLADALKVPSVVLFTGSDPLRWAPLDRELHRVIEDASGVKPAEVVDEAGDLLQKSSSYAL